MSSVLLVTSSPRAEESLSTRIAAELAEKIEAHATGSVIVRRDVGSDPIQHLDFVTTNAIRKAAADRTSDELVAELLAADTLILATGLVNFNVNSGLKSWIDNVARAGSTFRYTENGPQGLATGKKVYIVLASAGIYSEGPAATMEHAIPYLKTILGFMGMTDVEVIRVEGTAFGPDAAQKAIADAQARAEELALAA
jgi:FMN-dependent NADH-azoreductase